MKNFNASRPIIIWVTRCFLYLLLFNTYACASSNPQKAKSTQKDSYSSTDTRFTLNNATLEQADDRGQILWKIQTKSTIYSQDRKKANLNKITGNLFQDGKIVLQISAEEGEIIRGSKQGDLILLKKNIIAKDPRNGTVVTGDRVDWYPQKDLLAISQNFTGTSPKLEVSATEGKYHPRTQTLELSGNILATAIDPPLQIKTEHLSWQIPAEKIVGDHPLELVRYQNRTITDRVVAQKGMVTLKNNLVTIQNNVEFKSLQPLVAIATNSVVWNYKTRLVISNTPIQIVDSQQKMTVTGNQGQIDLSQQIAHFKNGVKGISHSDQATLYSQNLIWNISTQRIEALGNVIYNQLDPQLNLTGEKAVGKLQDRNVVVTSNGKKRVVTNIIPSRSLGEK